MKKFAAVVLASALSTTTEGKMMHGHHHESAMNHIRKQREHLEMHFGKGLVGLYNEQGDLDLSRLKWARRRPLASTWIDLGGQKFNAEDAESILYGFSYGFQYKEMPVTVPNNLKGDLVESNCFYAMYGLNDSIN